MKTRYAKTIETLKEHSRLLQPLCIGDTVFIQNQCGLYPKKWDKTGSVVEVKKNDQYVVKVDGSGRLTLRNRRFLRKYEPHHNQQRTYSHPSPAVGSKPVCSKSGSNESVQPQVRNGENLTPSLSPAPSGRVTPTALTQSKNSTSLGATPTNSTPLHMTPQATSPSTTQVRRIILPPEETEVPSQRRSSRVPTERTVYDASTGKYVAPKSVDINI